MSKKIIAYKAMDKNMMCRGKQYEVGKTYHEDKADCCRAGMHACENPLDVLHYYPLRDGPRFFEVECGGYVDKDDNDSKFACTELTVKGELKLADFIKLSVKTTFERAMHRVKAKESGYSSSAATSGYSSSAATSGYYSSAATSGNSSSAATSGNYSSAATSGYYSSAATSGDSSSAATSGGYSSAATSGGYSSAATSGDSSSAATSGGYSSAATSGDSSSAVSTGYRTKAAAVGKNSIAVANGAHSKALGAMGCYLVLTEYDDDDNMLWAKMAKVDGTHIKENVWYTLKNGEFVECKP